MFILLRHGKIYLRTIAIALALAVTTSPVPAESYEVIVVKNADLKPHQDVIRGFTDACDCDVQELRLPEKYAREKILLDSPDAVLAIGTTAFKQVRTIKDLPVIYTMVVPSEIAFALSQNISGVSMDISPQSYLSALRQIFPRRKRVGLLFDPKHTGSFVEEAAKAARSAGVELICKQVNDPRDVPRLLETMQDAIDIFWMVPDPTVVSAEAVDFLLRFSFQHKVPVFTFSKKYVEMGAVAALDIDPYDIGAQAGEIVKKLSKDRNESIRVYARRSHVTINRNVAAKMGVTISDELPGKVK